MEVFIEETLIYSVTAILLIGIVWIYLRKLKKESRLVDEKIAVAKEEGIHEPVTLHPVIDVNRCIRSGACITACPEKDIIGIRNGKATIINASHCIGHGACFKACPVQAISLFIGTEKRGVDLPEVDQTFQTNFQGIYIAGEMGGMGLIKNAVEQGKQAIDYLSKTIDRSVDATYDVIIVGAGPAGISASLAAKKLNLRALTLEQDSIGGTVFTFPRQKVVMTSSMDLPLHGKIRLHETSKQELLKIWHEVISKHALEIIENAKVEEIIPVERAFMVRTNNGDEFTARKILLVIGRRGSPRKLNIPGEDQEKVAYRLLEPELITGKEIVVVGGGDSAIESALLLAPANNVLLSYRGEGFGRLKPKNKERIKEAIIANQLEVLFESNLTAIEKDNVTISLNGSTELLQRKNDLVYIFAGGELPTRFLQKVGIDIRTKYGEAILKHDK